MSKPHPPDSVAEPRGVKVGDVIRVHCDDFTWRARRVGRVLTDGDFTTDICEPCGGKHVLVNGSPRHTRQWKKPNSPAQSPTTRETQGEGRRCDKCDGVGSWDNHWSCETGALGVCASGCPKEEICKKCNGTGRAPDTQGAEGDSLNADNLRDIARDVPQESVALTLNFAADHIERLRRENAELRATDARVRGVLELAANWWPYGQRDKHAKLFIADLMKALQHPRPSKPPEGGDFDVDRVEADMKRDGEDPLTEDERADLTAHVADPNGDGT